MKKSGFTLAEVLVTLGIVGVIAAMTLPTVVANYQKQVTVSKLKKFYTNFNQIIAMAKAENGEYNTWSYSSSLEFFEKYIKPYVNNISKVEYPVTINNVGSKTVVIFLNDGTFFEVHVVGWNSPKIIFFAKYPQKGMLYSNNSLYYIKKDSISKIQRDIFIFSLNSNGLIIPTYKITEANRADFIDLCKNCANPDCYHCTSIIYYDNWKIKDDYPW